MARLMRHIWHALPVAIAATLAACAVGPNFKRPVVPDGDYGSAAATVADGKGAAPQALMLGQDLPADWWAVFRSPALTGLVAEALRTNSDVKAAQAALRQSHELYRAQRAALWPSVQGNLGADRSKYAPGAITAPTTAPSTTYSLYTAQLSLTYTPDLFGGTRRALEAAGAQEEAARFQLEATYLTLASNVVVTAIQEASLLVQVQATERLLAVQHDLTDKVQHQQQLGTASSLDALTQRALELQTAVTLPPLRKQLSQARDALAALLGRLPSGVPSAELQLDELTLPEQVPVSLPSALIAQRPDVRQAEANLHLASAQAGVALAQMLPQFSLSADIGSTALTPGTLFHTGTGFWDLGASLAQTLFDAGALWHRYKASDAALDQAGAQYRSAVIAGCQNVADTLYALRTDADALQADTEAEAVADKAFALARGQKELGAISFVQVLGAEQLYQQALIVKVQAQASRLTDTAALYQALGGGWWNRPQGATP